MRTSNVARAMWKAVISLGDEEVPVKLYSAVKDRRVHFRLLDPDEQQPVQQKMVDPESGETVDAGQSHRAMATEEGNLVLLSDEDLAAAQPERSRTIEVLAHVTRAALGHRWYERPYYLGPDGDDEAYFALARALAGADAQLVVRYALRNKRHIGAVFAEGKHLALVTLRFVDEMVAIPRIEPGSNEPSDKEQTMARQLVESLVEDFDPAAYEDTYREKVLEYVQAKAEGKVVKLPRKKKSKATESLESALFASLEAARG